MTTNDVPAILDRILDPLNNIQEQVHAAFLLAQRNHLPRPFLQTIQGAIHDLERTWETLNEICTTLDPDRGTSQF